MTEKQMESIANEWGFVKASDYQAMKNKLAFAKAERMEYIASDEELSALILSIAGRLMARKRNPANMARPQKKKLED